MNRLAEMEENGGPVPSRPRQALTEKPVASMQNWRFREQYPLRPRDLGEPQPVVSPVLTRLRAGPLQMNAFKSAFVEEHLCHPGLRKTTPSHPAWEGRSGGRWVK